MIISISRIQEGKHWHMKGPETIQEFLGHVISAMNVSGAGGMWQLSSPGHPLQGAMGQPALSIVTDDWLSNNNLGYHIWSSEISLISEVIKSKLTL